jgi:hypothetical protein
MKKIMKKIEVTWRKRKKEFPYKFIDGYVVEYVLPSGSAKVLFIVVGFFNWDIVVSVKFK